MTYFHVACNMRTMTAMPPVTRTRYPGRLEAALKQPPWQCGAAVSHVLGHDAGTAARCCMIYSDDDNAILCDARLAVDRHDVMLTAGT